MAIQEISREYTDYKQIIYDRLKKEFSEDLKKWNAELLKDSIIIRFLSPEIMFQCGKKHNSNLISKKFSMIFVPRYFAVLSQFKKLIEEN